MVKARRIARQQPSASGRSSLFEARPFGVAAPQREAPADAARFERHRLRYHSLDRLALGGLAPGSSPRSSPVVQRVTRVGPDGEELEVTEVVDYLPNCVDNLDPERKMYRRSTGITEGWNDTDLFYADGDDGALVQITVEMVDSYWDPKYDGFTNNEGQDWTVNCEDYAKGFAGEGNESGDYTDTEELAALLPDTGRYVLKLSHHWMSVDKTGDDAVTIRQKDGESAVYSKDFDLAGACEYILGKRSDGGKVFKV